MKDVIDALIARLRDRGLTVYDTYVPDGTTAAYPYVLVWGPPGNRPQLNLVGARGLSARYGLTCAGLLPDAVREVAQLVHEALDGWTPGVVGGLNVDEVRFRDGESEPLRRDPDTPPVTGLPVLYGVDFYDVSATPVA